MLRTPARLNGTLECCMWTLAQRIAIWTVAGLIAAFGLMWLYTFGFTDYRGHLRMLMIPIALASLVYAVSLSSLKLWAIALSTVLSLIILIGTIGVLLAAESVPLPLLAIAVVQFLYISLLAPGILRITKERGAAT